MQEGFSENNKQEATVKLLLNSILSQEVTNCSTGLSSKKISNIVNRKNPVLNDIVMTSTKEEVFEIEDNYIRCNIPFDKYVLDKMKNENVGNNVGNNISLNKTEKKVIALLIENAEYTADELALKIGVTKRTIERTFISLKNKKVIERIGSNRKGSWIVIK